MIPRFDVLGVEVSALDMDGALAEITGWIERREPHYICVTGVHGVMEAQRDSELMRIHNASGMTTPDGMPLVWAGRWAGMRQVTRVYGPDLMLAVCALAQARGWTSYLYGGRDGVPDLLARRLVHRFPGLRIVGTCSPPFGPVSDEQDAAMVAEINRTAPDIIWVGLSTPKQERWMAANMGRVGSPVMLGVGAAFDIHAGLLPQAPGWLGRAGLEWLFRLAVEPRRLWRRYLSNNPRFILQVLKHPPRAT
jgi:N-acetylglucosaminyldiphosphoundecaprenol N-acetyl-beta-D-mannosaminyltransferase